MTQFLLPHGWLSSSFPVFPTLASSRQTTESPWASTPTQHPHPHSALPICCLPLTGPNRCFSALFRPPAPTHLCPMHLCSIPDVIRPLARSQVHDTWGCFRGRASSRWSCHCSQALRGETKTHPPTHSPLHIPGTQFPVPGPSLYKAVKSADVQSTNGSGSVQLLHFPAVCPWTGPPHPHPVSSISFFL